MMCSQVNCILTSKFVTQQYSCLPVSESALPRHARKSESPSPWTSAPDREREREAKREAVLRTAARFFNDRGYHATSLDDVAAALNVTKPTIYHYFANKDEILMECTRRGLNALATAIQAADREGLSGAERLEAIMMAHAFEMTDDFGICVARTQDQLLSPESRRQFRALKREIDGMIRATINRGLEDGTLQVPDVRIAAFTLGLALNSLGSWFRAEGPMSREDTVRLTVATLLNGLRSREEAR